MGNIGPVQQRFEVLPEFGVEDADLWRPEARPIADLAPPVAEDDASERRPSERRPSEH